MLIWFILLSNCVHGGRHDRQKDEIKALRDDFATEKYLRDEAAKRKKPPTTPAP
jgi:hypothetical protein